MHNGGGWISQTTPVRGVFRLNFTWTVVQCGCCTHRAWSGRGGMGGKGVGRWHGRIWNFQHQWQCGKETPSLLCSEWATAVDGAVDVHYVVVETGLWSLNTRAFVLAHVNASGVPHQSYIHPSRFMLPLPTLLLCTVHSIKWTGGIVGLVDQILISYTDLLILTEDGFIYLCQRCSCTSVCGYS